MPNTEMPPTYKNFVDKYDIVNNPNRRDEKEALFLEKKKKLLTELAKDDESAKKLHDALELMQLSYDRKKAELDLLLKTVYEEFGGKDPIRILRAYRNRLGE